MDAVDRAGRAPRRAGDHDLQGQGPDRRRPPAGRRRARPQRHAGGELGHERGRPAARASARRSRTTPASTPGQPIIQVDFDPMQLGKFHPVDGPGAGARSASPRGCSPSALPDTSSPRPTSAATSPRAGRSGAPRRPTAPSTTAATACIGRGLRRDRAPMPRRRRDRRRRRQQHLLVRALLRVLGRQRVLMSGYLGSIGFGYPGRDGRLGGDAATRADRLPSPATAASASTWPS